MMMDKMLIVTGASRGIGAAIAFSLAEAGYMVGCVSRSGAYPAIDDVPEEIRARWIPVVGDVSEEASFRAAFTALAEHGHSIVGLVNNAGLHIETPSAKVPIAEWDQVLSANATSVVIGCQAAFSHLAAAGGGLIVNIGSFFDKLGVKRNLAYCASKAAVGAITRVLAVEWAAQGIRAVNVAPGFILTDLNREHWEGGGLRAHLEKRIPGGSPGTPQDVAALVASLFALNMPFLNGETIYIDGGQSINA
jgi:NAD(P)-dependent dehydrogenase (short-subunit alcohol dehydrogenase family)